MNVLIALGRLVLIAFCLALVLGWLQGTGPSLGVTLPWTVMPVAAGMVAARVVIDWESERSGAALISGLVRVALMFIVIGIARWGFYGSINATVIAFAAVVAIATLGPRV